MELKGSRTEEVLKQALYLELFQDFKYRRFAEVARQTDLPQIAEMFETISSNEREHARHEYDFSGGPGDVTENLQHAAYSEHELVTDFYPKAAATAEQEGFKEIADFFNRIIPVEKKHEDSFINLEIGLQKGAEFEDRTVSHSAVEMAQLMLPAQANPAGFVHGGELMKLMDNAAGVVAARHAHSNVVTAQVEDIVFHTPVRVGSLVIVHGKLIFTSRSSMQIRVDVEVESISQERRVPALTANFIMVAVDSAGKPTKIPQLICLTEEEEKLFAEAEKRYKARKK
jgi:acyl-CoA hydrolase/rubrerythrin